MSTDTSLITFKAISNFTTDLAEVFDDKHHPLKLYAHLINKTTLAHDKPIQKHIEAFKEFSVANREALVEKDETKITKNKIIYSSRVYIDIKEIFGLADTETQGIIWKHLLTISALVDPTGKARQILQNDKTNKTNKTGEADFLSDIISKVEDNVDPNSNPMEAVTSIMQSGIFTDLVQGMGNGLEDGSLDLSKLMGTVQSMVTKLGNESENSGNEPGGDQAAMNMINTMMGSLNAGSNGSLNEQSNDNQQIPDLSNMLGPMMAMMAGNGNGNDMPNINNINNILQNNSQSGNPIEDNINSQLEKARKSDNS